MIRSVIMIRLGGGVSPFPFSSLPVLIHCIIMVSDFSFVFEIVFIFPLLFPPAQFILQEVLILLIVPKLILNSQKRIVMTFSTLLLMVLMLSGKVAEELF